MDIKGFTYFLCQNGAEIGEKTSPWEVLRYKLPELGTIVIYRNAKNKLTIPDIAHEHYEQFRKGKALKTYCRAGSDAKAWISNKIIERDGDICCFCGGFLNGDQTLEHWLSVTHGGNNSLENTGLAHKNCNHAAGSMGIMEKIRFRDQLRAAAQALPPWDTPDPFAVKEGC